MISQPKHPVILASASPRRKEILRRMGLSFHVEASQVDEHYDPALSPREIAEYLAKIKAASLSEKYPDAVIIGADTIVVFQDRILGKPDSDEQAVEMLSMLSGKEHSVITGFSVQCGALDLHYSDSDETSVLFRSLSRDEILDYVRGGSPMDKAGAYGIQDLDANLVRSVSGCYMNVIGFPAAAFQLYWDGIFRS